MSDEQRLQLTVLLKQAKIGHLNRMSAVAASGWIFSEASLAEGHEGLNKAIEALNRSLNEAGISHEQYFSGMMIFNIVSEVELYFSEVVKHILMAYPEKVGSTQFKLSEILGSSQDELLGIAADKFLHTVMYKKPLEYLTELCNMLSVSEQEIRPLWLEFVETKARRDLGIHNNWIVNNTYLRKVREVGLQPQLSRGDKAWPSNEYVRLAYENCCEVVSTLSGLLELKYPAKP